MMAWIILAAVGGFLLGGLLAVFAVWWASSQVGPWR